MNDDVFLSGEPRQCCFFCFLPLNSVLLPSGVTMLPCGSFGAHPVLCLDVCGGYAGKLPGYDQYLYRYYMAGSAGSGECSSTVENAGVCAREEGMKFILFRTSCCTHFFHAKPAVCLEGPSCQIFNNSHVR